MSKLKQGDWVMASTTPYTYIVMDDDRWVGKTRCFNINQAKIETLTTSELGLIETPKKYS